jgi:hypothetical protein
MPKSQEKSDLLGYTFAKIRGDLCEESASHQDPAFFVSYHHHLKQIFANAIKSISSWGIYVRALGNGFFNGFPGNCVSQPFPCVL